MVLFALAAAMMVGMLGLVFDGGRIYFEKRHMQTAADAGVIAAVQEMKRGNRDLANEMDPAARNDIGLNSYTAANSRIFVNSPPTSGPSAGSNLHVEVIIEQDVASTFMRIVNQNQSTVRVRAVGGLLWGGDPCVVALNETIPAALTVGGNTTVTADCGVYSNSPAINALNSPSSTGCITGTWAGMSGQANGPCLTFPDGIDEDMPPIPDPLAIVQPEPSCLGMGQRTGPPFASTFRPGRFPNQITIPNGNHTFMPGIYCIEGGLRVTGGSITGSEVMFYIVNPGGVPNDAVLIAGNVSANLSAPTSGPYQGILFFGARTNATWLNPGNQILGDSTSSFTGAIYFRNEPITFSGNSSTTNHWAMVVGDTVTFTGNSGSRFMQRPTDPNTAPPLYRVALVE
jgi:hypothetical protein